MKINTHEVGDATVLELHGKLTGGPEAETFRTIFKDLVKEGRKKIIINLGKVSWINSTGLGILISGYTTLRREGGDIVLTNVSDRIESILYVTKLNLLFKTFDSEEEALKGLEAGE